MERDGQVTISELARLLDVTPRTIRYYVSEGLLPPPVGAGLRSSYGYEHFVRLRLIKRLQAEDVPLRKIKASLTEMTLPEMEQLLATEAKERRPRAVGPRELLSAVLRSSMPDRDCQAAEPPLLLRQSIPSTPPLPMDSTWRRVSLAPGVELHYTVPATRGVEAAMREIAAAVREILARHRETGGR